MENKKCLKPPTSLSFNGRMHQTSILLADKKYPANKSFFDLPKVPSPTGICPPRPRYICHGESTTPEKLFDHQEPHLF